MNWPALAPKSKEKAAMPKVASEARCAPRKSRATRCEPSGEPGQRSHDFLTRKE